MSDTVNYSFVPAPRVNPNATRTVMHDYKLKDIDALEGGRDNYILVMVENPKKPDSIAFNNWYLYGNRGQPSVTVKQFIKSYPKGDRGVDRARASLIWDLNRELIRIVKVEQ